MTGPSAFCRSVAGFAIAASLSIGLAPMAAAQGSGDKSASAPAVVVAPVTTQDVTRSAEFVGRIEAIQQVDIRARVEGFLDKVEFVEGSTVKQDTPLYLIEQDTYQAQVDTAKATIASAKAQLASAEAARKNASLELERRKELLQSGTVSQATVDDFQAKYDEAQASVEQAQAAIEQGQAQLKTANINLSYTKIASPITGRIGKTNLTVGNLVGPSTGALATVVQMNPIRVVFSIAETDYLKVLDANKKASADEIKKALTVKLKLADGSTYEHDGKISFINNTVDQQTGTVAVRANFANPRQLLVPGQFVNVDIQVGEPQKLPVVPASAVQQDRQGAYVFVLDKDDKVQERRIETAKKMASGWAVSKGVENGELIVVSGIQKIKPGIKVAPTKQSSGG
ncbi:efflux RND transporter periplasmic adaptor subunit [Kaustia mangrovi]|uniref:Efflux RND transporter periplasmic adaptor subunit n=1 Tax=Kaustia mangrovi TaxID=2593653 RepID=A0A7S8C2X1_9HYPH|nr:efflux RND transporter periplasmic adaptor subunit [Kaustia mangrovi]QPC42363.1 efflux RND transporter periplasmic adaptor subunit [Kaustia mangrovi]